MIDRFGRYSERAVLLRHARAPKLLMACEPETLGCAEIGKAWTSLQEIYHARYPRQRKNAAARCGLVTVSVETVPESCIDGRDQANSRPHRAVKPSTESGHGGWGNRGW